MSRECCCDWSAGWGGSGRRVDSATREGRSVAVLRDATGNQIAGERSDVELSLTDETYARFLAAGGLNLVLNLKAPPGEYTARGLLLDGIEGKMLTANSPVRVP